MATSASQNPVLERTVLEAARRGPRLLWEADALLTLIPELRATGFVADLANLREQLATMLRDFRAHARRDGIEPMRVEQATEVLAASIDHVVTSMPWGAESGWRSLGAVPAPLDGRSASAAATQRLLEVAGRSFSDSGMRELIGVAVALGFDGNSAASAQINQLRTQLAVDASHDSARVERDLAPQSQSSVERGSFFTGWLSLWVTGAVAVAALAVLFFSLQLSLAAKSDRLYARIATLNAPSAQAPGRLPAAEPRLAGLLPERAANGSVQVLDEIDRSVVVIPGSALFAANSASLRAGGAALLRPVAAALTRTPGRIQIIGHTDGHTVLSARYPSDWDLSVDRARTVQDALRELGIEASRMTYDGRGSVEPLVQESPAPGADGRVEIVLLAGR
jgi:type VI secretion system protein ImpK